MNEAVPRPKYLQGVDRLPVAPLREDELRRLEYRKFLKIRTFVFFVLACCFLSLGIFLLIKFNRPNDLTYEKAALMLLYDDDTWAASGSQVGRASGIVLTVLGAAFAIVTSVYFPTFVKLVSSRSSSVVYHPKSATALQKMKYPRQPKDAIPDIPPVVLQMPSAPPMPMDTYMPIKNPPPYEP